MMTRPKTAGEIETMREAGDILRSVFIAIAACVEVGTTGLEINELVDQLTRDAGGRCAFNGFHGYPANLCISVNDVAVHGIPTPRPFESDDIITFDFGVELDGLVVDSAVTLSLGHEAKNSWLVLDAYEAMMAGISVVRPGVTVGEITKAISTSLEGLPFRLVSGLGGHGVGHSLHEDPYIAASVDDPVAPEFSDFILLEGMTVAIEPVVTSGNGRIMVDRDGWSIFTTDGAPCAQFEETVLVTQDGWGILT